MQELVRELKEYNVVREMAGVGDITRFHSKNALIAYSGIDAPPYQSGKFTATNRKISKRGSGLLRKTGYEVMKCLMTHKPLNDSVYQYILKKEEKGKAKKVAKIAGA